MYANVLFSVAVPTSEEGLGEVESRDPKDNRCAVINPVLEELQSTIIKTQLICFFSFTHSIYYHDITGGAISAGGGRILTLPVGQ